MGGLPQRLAGEASVRLERDGRATKQIVVRKLKGLVATLAMTLLLAAPAFAQRGFFGFNDLDGGNCVVNDFVEICDTIFGSGGL